MKKCYAYCLPYGLFLLGASEDTVTNQEMVRHASPSQEPKSDASDTNVDTPEDAASGEKEGKEGWLSGWGFGGLPVLSDVVHKTSSIVQKTGTAVYQTVEKTTNVVSVRDRLLAILKFCDIQWLENDTVI